MAAWTRLVRFENESGNVRLGEPVDPAIDVGLACASGRKVEVYLIEGGVFDGIVTQQKAVIKKLLGPISKEHCSLIRCLGLNYKAHAAEANMALPTAPILFIKPRTALSGPGELLVSKAAQNHQLDFETELAVVIGKDCRDASQDNALDYVLGYTGSNDVSARKFQMATSQWCFGKGLDQSCPIGPVLVRTSQIDGDALDFKGVLSGEVVQASNTSDMIFGIKKTISYLSQGTTLEKGTIIQMGTPSGIGWARSPQRIIQDGETMHIWFDGIGTLVNTFVYE